MIKVERWKSEREWKGGKAPLWKEENGRDREMERLGGVIRIKKFYVDLSIDGLDF